MGCRVLLIRHGETVWNKDLKLQGQADIPLSDNGLEQARALSKRLASWQLDAFFASTLTRAITTAEIIAQPHLKQVSAIADLQEINFGAWEGLTFKQISQQDSETVQKWWAKPLSIRIPGGETLAELAQRSARAMEGIVHDHQGQTVAVAAHGGVIRCIVATVLGLNLNDHWRLRQDNASLSIINFHTWEKGALELFNDCSHLSNVR